MAEYIVKRLLQGILVVLAVTILLFAIMQMMPGDPIMLICGDRVSAEMQAQIRTEWGLDQPIPLQYLRWLGHIVTGDFGQSITTGQPVVTLLLSRLPYTLLLSGLALVLQYLIGVPVGLVAAYKRDSIFDRAVVSVSTVFWSIPSYWLGVLLVLAFAVSHKIFPVSGFSGPISLVLPLASLVIPGLASVIRMARADAMEVLYEKMVVTAYAKGLDNRRVLVRHVLRNALIPTTIMFFLSLPWVIGGAVVVEKIFAWPGMGQLLWKSIVSQDYPVVQGIVFIIALLTVLSNTLGDLLTGWLDPRIRRELRGPAA